MGGKSLRNLFEAGDDVEVAESAIKAVDVGFGIRGHERDGSPSISQPPPLLGVF
jgi:hypothetical protein